MAMTEEDRTALKRLATAMGRLRELDNELPIQGILSLLWIASHEGSTQRDMIAALGMPASTTSRNIAALSNVHRLGKPGLDLVTWVAHPTDRRVNLLHLTTKGRALCMKILDDL